MAEKALSLARAQEPIPSSTGERSLSGRGFALIALAIAAVLLSYLASMATIADDGASNWNVGLFLHGDTINPWLMFRGAFIEQAYPLDGYRTGVAPFYFPDLFALFFLYALGAGPVSAHAAMPLVFALMSIGGWVAVSSKLYGRSAARIAAIIFLHSLPFLGTAAGPSDVYPAVHNIVSHYGTWVCMPWLLFLTLHTLDGNYPGRAACGLAILLALVAASDLVAVPWFVAPVALIIAIYALPAWRLPSPFRLVEHLPKNRRRLAASALAAGVVGGYMLDKASPFIPSRHVGNFISPNLGSLADTTLALAGVLGDIAIRNPASTVIWTMFATLSAWRLWKVLFAGVSTGAESRALALVGVPPGRSHAIVALFLPFSVASAVAALIITGNIQNIAYQRELMFELRYILPIVGIPLFAGWSLLPWKHPALAKRAGAAVAAAATVAMLASGSLAFARLKHLPKFDIYASSFHECFASAAQRLGWKGGIGTFPFQNIIASPKAEVERYIPVGVIRKQAEGESFLYLDWHIQNRHSFIGDFQFVVVNGDGETAIFEPPVRMNALAYAYDDLHNHTTPKARVFILDEQVAIGAFGEPQETIECSGVAFLHYDPPIRQDFSKLADPAYELVGVPF